MQTVEITEAYMRIDAFGTGVPVLHKLICGGQDYELLDYMPCDEIPYAKLECDPEPHSFYGRSLAELICDDQDAATAVLRGILDNVALTNSPRLAFKEGSVNIDDLMTSICGKNERKRWDSYTRFKCSICCRANFIALLTWIRWLSKDGNTERALNPDALHHQKRLWLLLWKRPRVRLK